MEEFKGISGEEVEKLRAVGIATVTDLWSRVGRDFDDGIHDLSEETSIPAD
jgi:hypothetical protein